MMKNLFSPRLLAASLGVLISVALHAGEVEVLHHWTSGGEAKSVAELKSMMAARGHTWKDFAVTGGGGENAMAVLKRRVLSGKPPAAALIKGPAIQELAQLNVLTSLDSMAQFEKWDELLPKVVADQMKYKGHYVAVPVNVHRVNWLWGNNAVLKASGVQGMPKTYDEFFAAADKIKAAGFMPVAHGGQDWQDFTVFESVVLGVGGVDLYNNALVKLDRTALSSDGMRQSLAVFRHLKGYVDDKALGREWNKATELVMTGKAGFQFMGDWAKGEFLAANQQPSKDFSCAPAPGTAQAYTYNVDSFAMFELKNWEAQKAQGYLAYLLLGETFQEKFNLRKGSIPVRLNVSMDRFDECARQSSKDFVSTAASGQLLPSVAHGMAIAPAAQALMQTAVSEFWNNDKKTVDETITALLQVGGAQRK